jgi:hypothetical protein
LFENIFINMASSFLMTHSPTPFALFDADQDFASAADQMVTYVKLRLGDPQTSVEISKKQIWGAFEEATAKFGALVNSYQAKSQLSSILGMPTGSMSAMTNKYPVENLEAYARMANAYAYQAGVGGNYDTTLGYIDLTSGQQDYNIYTELKNTSGSVYFNTLPSGSHGKLRILEVFHFDPIAAQQFLLNASNLTNFLATEFSFESYVNSTIFYVLPVFEDVLRRGMLELATKVRRSHYTYEIVGRNIRIFPVPSTMISPVTMRLWMRVISTNTDPIRPTFQDDSIYGVSGLSNAPYGNITFSTINSIGRRWITDYTLAICKEVVGLVRSKFKTVPIPGNDLTLNGEDLINQSKEEREKLLTELKELLESLTYQVMTEKDASRAENLNKILKFIPLRKGITIG